MKLIPLPPPQSIIHEGSSSHEANLPPPEAVFQKGPCLIKLIPLHPKHSLEGSSSYEADSPNA